MLQVGVVALAIGVLIYFASRSVNGGLAGVLLSGMFSWFAFELGISIVRGLGPLPTGVKPRHATLSGCMTVIAACLGLGLILFTAQQVIPGLILGGLASVVTHRTRLPTLAQMGGLDVMPDTTGAIGQSIPLGLLRPVAVVVALLFLLVGVAFAGLGTARFMESYSYVTDVGCAHPCAMVHGLWAKVLPDARGDHVTRLDSDSVQIRLRFRDDVAEKKVANRTNFTVTHLSATYRPMADRQGCGDWAPQVLHLDESTGDLALCFAIAQSQESDLSQLILDWTDADATAPISLGKTATFSWGFSTG